jgi:TyrR family helix-turn-helix protein
MSIRQDLYCRLNAFTIHIPPLRERVEDIFELVHHYLEKYNHRYGTRKRIGSDGLLALQGHSFPGNVRELKNLVKKAVVMSDDDRLDRSIRHSLGKTADAAPAPSSGHGAMKLKDEMAAHEKALIKAALSECASTRSMARRLGIDHSTVVRKLRKHGLTPCGVEMHRNRLSVRNRTKR